MRKIRNPQYAPEFLGRRLNPSPMGVAPIAAEVSMAGSFSRCDESPTYPPVEPTTTTDPSNPTAPTPTEPGGPYLPAFAS